MQIDKGIPLQTQERENYFKISSQMSQAEGLSKLTEYLKQTKRQAEAAVDHLNKEIIRLNEENSSLKRILHKVSQEREEYLTTVEELKIKNTNKYKLKERDDWKNLVDQVQQDRTRLQQENEVLMHQLESSAAEMKNLQLHIESLETELSQKESAEESVELTLPSKSPTKSPRTPSKKIPTPLSSPNKSVRQRSFSFRADTKIEEEEQIPPVITEIPPETIIEQGNLDIDTIIAQLKQQLQRTYDQMKKNDEDQGIVEVVAKTIEFNQLRVQLNDYHRKIESASIFIHPHPSQLVNPERHSRQVVQPYQATSWFGGLFSFFSSSPDDSTYIINV